MFKYLQKLQNRCNGNPRLKGLYLYNCSFKSHYQNTIWKPRSSTLLYSANPKPNSHSIKRYIEPSWKWPNIATVLEPTVCICYSRQYNSLADCNKGILVAQVHVIFQLPSEYGFETPLAYVEWYTPLQLYSPSLRMYQVSRSSWSRYQCASIIPVTQIIQSCHLIPKFSTKIGYTWDSENVLDFTDVYYLNPDLQIHDFIVFR